MVPHQQIFITRDVHEFYDIFWEPNHHKVALHTLSKREAVEGRKDYTAGATRSGVDIYEMRTDKVLGFVVENIGSHPAEKVTNFTWSPSGDIFGICEKEGITVNAKHIWSFYLI